MRQERLCERQITVCKAVHQSTAPPRTFHVARNILVNYSIAKFPTEKKKRYVSETRSASFFIKLMDPLEENSPIHRVNWLVNLMTGVTEIFIN